MSILRSLDGMKDIYGISTKKQSPKYINININKIRSPTVGGDGSEKMMSYALSSTTKKTGSDGEDETIRIETHVPKLPDDIERRVSAEFGGEDDFTTSEAIDLAETALKETRCKDLFILQGITPAELLKSKNVKINFKDLSNRHLS